jgi:hypothetical protein
MPIWDIMDEVDILPPFCIRLIHFSLTFGMYKLLVNAKYCIFKPLNLH